MPKDLAGNEERWKDVLGKTSRAMPTPKSLVRSSPHFQNILKSYEEARQCVGRNIDFVVVK